MSTYVALLYSVVIDSKRRVAMSDLREIAESVGCRNVRTLVSSGNIVFDTDETSVSTIERALEAAFAAFYVKHVDIIVKPGAEWQRIVAANPFGVEAEAAPDRVSVRIMRDAPRADLAAFLYPYQTAGEQVAIIDGHVWVHFSGQPTLSRLAGQLTPKRMGGIGTARNWNTVKNLGELVAEKGKLLAVERACG